MPTRPLDGAGAAPGTAFPRRILRADVVYNGLGTPRENGAVVVQETPDGATVVDVASLAEARSAHPTATEEDAGFAITPPPVNAHTHLDLSDLPFTPGYYEAFIRAVIVHGRDGKRGAAAARRGLAELRACGTSVVGDIVTDPEVMALLLAAPDLTGVAFWEVFAPDPSEADAAFERTRRQVNAFRERERAAGVRVGISPHTPHTVSAPLLRRLAAWARDERLPMAVHVAESPGEARLHRDGDGPLADALAAAGFPFAATGVSPLRYLADLGVLAASPTLVHMVEVDEDDVRQVQRAGCVVVHCPRSNDALGCRRFPWEIYARHGVDVAFGTDSRGSSPDLDVTAEVAFATTLHGARANARALVRAAVKGGYRALGLEPPRVTRGASAAALVRWPR
ncbi:MAG: amidohydrolase family protein [Trueperaceae bacterium]